jgi:hypothetical protein
MNYGHLFGPFVNYKMWLLFKRANKIHVLLFIVHFQVPTFISFNPSDYTPTPPSQAMQVWTHLRLRSPLHTSLDLFNVLHLNQGHRSAHPALW